MIANGDKLSSLGFCRRKNNHRNFTDGKNTSSRESKRSRRVKRSVRMVPVKYLQQGNREQVIGVEKNNHRNFTDGKNTSSRSPREVGNEKERSDGP
ncbi:unnamed protein product, partial [Dovyalis caffra]